MPQQFTAAFAEFRSKILDSFSRQPFMSHLGAEMTDVEAGYCEIQVPINDALTQQHGFFHGGVVATIADNTCGYAAFTLMPEDASVLSVEFKVNFMKPAAGDLLVARGKVIRKGRTLSVAQSDVFVLKDGNEIHCATCQATLIVLPNSSDSQGS